MAVYNVRTICFLVLVVVNAGQASVQKSSAAPGFQGGKSFAPKPEHNGPNLKATDQRVSALEKIIEDLLHDNDKKERRLEHLEAAIEIRSQYLEATDKRLNDLEKKIAKLSRDNARKEVDFGNMETAKKKQSPYEEATDKRADNLERKIDNLKSTLVKDCGSPPSVNGAYVHYISTTAVYRCMEGFQHVHRSGKAQSVCHDSEIWTPVNIKCINVSACSTFSLGKAVYTGTQSKTISGRTCQRWDTQTPHTHNYGSDGDFTTPGLPQTVSGSANYCRDPSGDGFLWCYTTDPNKRWEKCSVPMC